MYFLFPAACIYMKRNSTVSFNRSEYVKYQISNIELQMLLMPQYLKEYSKYKILDKNC